MVDSNIRSNSYKAVLKRIFNFLILTVPISFPYSLRISSLLTILLTLIWLLLGYYKNIPVVLKNKGFFMLALIFIIPSLTLMYSDNKDFSLLEKRFFLLLYPLVLFTIELTQRHLFKILYAFSVSCTLASFYVLILTLYYNEPLGTEMTHQHIGITHVYFGLYLSFSITALSYFLITKNKQDYWSGVLAVQIIFMLFFLFALGAKMSIISLFLLMLIACMILIVRAKRWLLGALLILIPSCIFIITITSFDIVKYRFFDLFNYENYFVGDNAWNSIAVRLSVFKCTFEVFGRDPFLGTGVGDVQSDLDKCYENLGLLSVKGMNAHNQYFQFLLSTGIVGLLVIVIVFVYTIAKGFLLGNKLFLCFIFLFLFCCLTESILERQYGTMFYGFFNTLLFFHFHVEKKDKKNLEA